MADSPIKPVDREELKRQIARKVDPRAWELEDAGAFRGYAQQKAIIRASLAKAEAILALPLLSTIEELERERAAYAAATRNDTLKDAAIVGQLEARAQSAEALLREAVEVVRRIGNLTRDGRRTPSLAMIEAEARLLLSKLTEGR